MRILIFMLASAVLLLEDVASEEDGIKRGTFPFMAFVYYPDQTVDDGSGGKFTRSAVLIRQNWLISASLESENTTISFPEKTLMARLGAISIDVKFNFNEDEDEQEREIIRIVRSYDFNSTEWWYNDISLLKTLLPFNVTSAVATFATVANKLNFGKNCYMLIYTTQDQKTTGERVLMKISVELIPSSLDKCGNKFSNDTMVCAALKDEKSKIYANPNFCLGNSGGPLICGNDLIGTQTYIDSCNQPYLYQFLNSWDDLISCAMEEKCHEEQCAKICFNINKDPITVTTPVVSVTEELKVKLVTEEVKVKLVDGYVNETSIEIIITPTFTTLLETSETETVKTTPTTIKEKQDITEVTTSRSDSRLNSIEDTPSESSENTERDITDFPEESERKTNFEAKQHIIPRHNDASINTLYSLKYFMCGYFVLVCLT